MSLSLKISSLLLFITTTLSAQNFSKNDDARIISYKKTLAKDTVLNSIPFKNIGPSIMSGRAIDIDVNPNNTNEFYVAYASGGLWHSTNNGMSFTPIFDKETSITIGDIAVNWKENIIWIGTGECNSSRSSYAGTGIYKSIDSGKTWQHKGLTITHHISKILLDNNNKNKIIVASIGPLYTHNEDAKGIFISTDGGDNWVKKSFTKSYEEVGVIDLVRDASNSKNLYACTWQRSRSAWNFEGHGDGSAIYKSSDEGNTWKCLTGASSGFPKDDGVGRIGIAQCKTKPNVWYALLDNQNHQSEKENKKKELKALDIKDMNEESFQKLDDKKLNSYLKENGYPEKYTAKSIKQDLKEKKYTVAAIANWVLSDGGAALFQTPVIGAELYRSDDYGTSWTKTHDKLIDGLYFTYGYYFGTINVNPNNADEVYIAGYTALKSKDGGKTFKEIVGDNCHADHHRIWINDKNSNHIISCNDGGINITYDDGKKWYKANNPAVGQFYAIAVDDDTPYKVYGGLQDNGTWVGPSTYKDNDAWHQNGVYAYKEIGGGDGMQIQVDTRDNATIYTGYQFGYYQRTNLKNDKEYEGIHPSFDIGDKPLRFNWQTPICLSKHNQDILYMGSNCFHRSMNKGAEMKKLSEDLTTNNKKGNVPFGTITSITESAKRFGLIYCGTDDGKVWMSNDVGFSFNEIAIPEKNLWVSRIIASAYKESRVYLALNGYRNDNFLPYLYSSEDFGKTWKNIAFDLPNEPINVVREDPKKENIIYVGTDNGLYISYDFGKTFLPWISNLPRVAIHDIAIQERENEIVLGTHGRSIYIAQLNEIQLFDSLKNTNQLIVQKIKPIKWKENWGAKNAIYADVNEAKIDVAIYNPNATTIDWRIINTYNKIIYSKTDTLQKGFNHIQYNASIDEKNISNAKNYKGDNGQYYLKEGQYKLEVTDKITKQKKVVDLVLENKEEK